MYAYGQNLLQKGLIFLVPITKDEAFELRKRNFGEDVKHTYTKHKKYFCVENILTLQELDKIRNEKIIYAPKKGK